MEALTASIEAPRLRVTFEEAEIIKNAANAFLALKLSFTNELAVLSEHYDADVERVMEGIGYDPRIGTSYLRPSYGFGGSCLPKELQTITLAGWERGVIAPLRRNLWISGSGNISHPIRSAKIVASVP